MMKACVHDAKIVLAIFTSDLFRIERPSSKGGKLIWPQILREIADRHVLKSQPFEDLLVFVARTKHEDSVVFPERSFIQELPERLPIKLSAWGRMMEGHSKNVELRRLCQIRERNNPGAFRSLPCAMKEVRKDY